MFDTVKGRTISRRQLLRLLSEGAALAGLASIVSACGDTSGGATTSTGATAPTGGSTSTGTTSGGTTSTGGATTGATATSAPSTGGKSVTLSFITPAALGTERDLYTSFVNDYQKAHPNVTIKLSFEAWDDYMMKLPAILAGGVIPDVIHQHGSIVQDYGQRGALADLTPFMKKDGVAPDDYVPALFDAFSQGGKTFGIPKDSAAWGLYYNKQMFDKAGIPYPTLDWTMDQFHDYARRLTFDASGRPAGDPKFDANNIKQLGFSWMDPTPTASENARGFVKAFGGDWYNDAYTATTITDQPAVDMFTMFYQMRCAEHATPTTAQSTAQGDPFRTGLTAMAVAFHSMDFFAKDEKVMFPYDVTFLPKGPGGQYCPVGCSGWAIPQNAKQKDDSWQFIKYLTSEDVQKAIGAKKRWGVARKSVIDAIMPDSTPATNFRKVHVDPLQGKGNVQVIAFKFPPNQSQIKQAYATNFDPLATCGTSDVKGAAQRTKQQVDMVLKGGG